MGGYALGVDLGTTFTAASVHTGHRPEPVTLGAKSLGIPSIVYLVEDGSYRIGEEAIAPAMEDPTRLVYEFKRHIGSDTELLLPDGPRPATHFSALLLRWVLVRVVQRMHAERPEVVAVTHPAHWNDHLVARHRDVLRAAGIPDALTVTEPEAAAIYYATQAPVAEGDVVAVYDLGGGTFDTAVVRREAEGFSILGRPGGIAHLGGADFDKVIYAIVNDHLDGAITDLDFTDGEILTDLHLLAEECTRAKEQLSSNTHVTIPVRVGTIKQSIRVTRTEFERALRPRIGETIATLEEALRSADVHPSDLSRVLLVGGSSRIPLVRAMVEEAMAVPVSEDTDPVAAVAVGASIYAHVHGPSGTGAFEARARAAPPPAAPSGGGDSSPPTVTGERVEGDVSVWIRGDMSPLDPPAPAAERAPTLRVRGPDGVVRVLSSGDELRVGRSADNDVVLADPVVSRHHGMFSYDDRDGWRFTDAGSQNGTYLDGRLVSEPSGEDGSWCSAPLPVRGVLRMGASGPEMEVEVDPSRSPPGSTVRIRCDGRTLTTHGARRFLVGRAITSDLVVDDLTRRVSSTHLELRPSGTGWVIVDVSANGTFRAGLPVGVDPFPAVPGDELRLGAPDGPLLAVEDATNDPAAAGTIAAAGGRGRTPGDDGATSGGALAAWWRQLPTWAPVAAAAVAVGVVVVLAVAIASRGGDDEDDAGPTTIAPSTTLTTTPATTSTTTTTTTTTTVVPTTVATQEVEVPGDVAWTDAGVAVASGDRITLTASGSIRHDATNPDSAPVGPAGAPEDQVPDSVLNTPGLGVYTAPPGHGGLIARITAGPGGSCDWDGDLAAVFGVGDRAEVTAERDGRLCLGINDFNTGMVADAVANNDGAFAVTVRVTGSG